MIRKTAQVDALTEEITALVGEIPGLNLGDLCDPEHYHKVGYSIRALAIHNGLFPVLKRLALPYQTEESRIGLTKKELSELEQRGLLGPKKDSRLQLTQNELFWALTDVKRDPGLNVAQYCWQILFAHHGLDPDKSAPFLDRVLDSVVQQPNANLLKMLVPERIPASFVLERMTTLLTKAINSGQAAMVKSLLSIRGVDYKSKILNSRHLIGHLRRQLSHPDRANDSLLAIADNPYAVAAMLCEPQKFASLFIDLYREMGKEGDVSGLRRLCNAYYLFGGHWREVQKAPEENPFRRLWLKRFKQFLKFKQRIPQRFCVWRRVWLVLAISYGHFHLC